MIGSGKPEMRCIKGAVAAVGIWLKCGVVNTLRLMRLIDRPREILLFTRKCILC